MTLRSAWILPLILVAVSLAVAAPPKRVEETALKAEYLFRFPLYVDWPEDALDSSHRSFRLGIVGDTPIAQALQQRVASGSIKDRPVELLSITSTDQLAGCHMVFIAAAAELPLRDLLAETANRPILTVSESEGFGELGVLINLYLADDSVRFEINQDAVRRSGLELRSKLYRVARIIGGGEP